VLRQLFILPLFYGILGKALASSVMGEKGDCPILTA